MSVQDEQVVRDAYAAFAAQDVPRMQQLFSPDVVWHEAGRNPLSGDHKGFDAVMAFFGRVGELSEGTFVAELHDVCSGDGHTVSLHTGRAEARGNRLEDHEALVWHVRDGRLAECWAHHQDLYASDAFWGA
jgi:ketosteroid isomerase-like protein